MLTTPEVQAMFCLVETYYFVSSVSARTRPNMIRIGKNPGGMPFRSRQEAVELVEPYLESIVNAAETRPVLVLLMHEVESGDDCVTGYFQEKARYARIPVSSSDEQVFPEKTLCVFSWPRAK